jgi:N-methylhydantoinase A
MQSGGGLIDAAAAGRHAAWMVLSGPAAGAAGGAYAAVAAGSPDVLCLDMGGTSADVCVVDDGAVRERSSGVLAGRPIALPMLDVHTVGAGGGSVAWRDAGGALRVGPRSAGADPGPACYGRGGTEPTVTDANLLLGYLSSENALAGGVSLDAGAAERAVNSLADDLGLELIACAEGIVRVANAEMVRALRVITVERGVDPRRYAMLAFGGAGPLHAAAIADELGIETIVCPRASGVLAALGLIVAPRRRDAQRTVLLTGEGLTEDKVRDAVQELGEQARRALGEPEAELGAVYELRYRGQAFELAIAAGVAPSADELREAFEAEHEERYGYRDESQELELVTVRVAATLAGAEPSLGTAEEEGGARAAEPGEGSTRRATFAGEAIDLRVLSAPPPGTDIEGPTVVELPEATLLVPPGWAGQVDDAGTIRLER